jgi:hypothetical protein
MRSHPKMCSTRIDRKQDEFASVTNLTNPMTIFFLHLLVESGRVTTSMPLRVPIQKKGKLQGGHQTHRNGYKSRASHRRSGKKWVKIIHPWDSPPISFSFPLLSPVHKIELLPVPCILSDCCFRFHSSWGEKMETTFSNANNSSLRSSVGIHFTRASATATASSRRRPA